MFGIAVQVLFWRIEDLELTGPELIPKLREINRRHL